MVSRRNLINSSLASGLTAVGRPAVVLAQPLTTLRFGMLPYADHTQASIGIEKGWFEKVGINLRANVIRIEEVVIFLKNGTYDVVSTPPGVLIAGYNEAPGLVMASFGDLFQGFALLGRPDRNYRSYSEFLQQGSSPQDALRLAVQQLRGARFVYPPEGGIRPFVDLVMEYGSLTFNDLKPIVVDDPVGVAIMRRGDGDFEVGGVPARLALQKAGFKVIVSAVDFARLAAPSSNSKALQAVLPGGWAIRRDLYEKNPEIIRRLACVSFQINQFIHTNPDEAGAIHMKFLSKATGQLFDSQDAKIIYNDLDPFLTFDEQARWFEDKSYPLYYEYLIGAQIESFIEDKTFQGTPPTVEDITIAASVYNDLVALRQRCEGNPALEKRALDALGTQGYFACAN